MGLFSKKSAQPTPDDESAAADVLLDEQYREELRQLGRQQLKDMIESQAPNLEQTISAMTRQISDDLQAQLTRQVDSMMSRLNDEITTQLNDRLREHDNAVAESRDLVTQSLSRNAQMIHEKYQQLSINLQRVVADQEVMMATVFQDSRTLVSSSQAELSKLLDQLRTNEQTANQQAAQLTESLRQTVGSQSTRLNTVYQENLNRVAATHEAQAEMLEKLRQTTRALDGQYQQLNELLDSSIADQKAMVAKVIDENMARIVEHYLIGALGEQSNLRTELPSILKKMEDRKQAMMDDMQL